jgi:glycosyltransferase EpsJ
LLSFIIPTYNCEEYLVETLGSVLPQLREDVELIIVDDGSSDSTPKMLKAYEGTKNVTIEYRAHAGVSVTRNAGLDLACGKYVTFMDCDDVLKDGFFDEGLALAGKDADLYIFSFERVENAGDPEHEISKYLTVENHSYKSNHEFSDDLIRKGAMLIYSACNKFYKRDILNENGIRFREDISFGEDRLFNYEYINYCNEIETSEILMFRYMQRNLSSATHKHLPNYFKTVLMLHDAKMKCFLPLAEETTEEERENFETVSLLKEIRNTRERFDEHPEEMAENLPLIEKVLKERKKKWTSENSEETET